MTDWRAEPSTIEIAPIRGFDDFELRLGDIMRGERATLGKSMLDVQRELKIRASHIAAIENADISAFRHHGIVAGYVRSYARYLGLDPEWALSQFCTESGLVVSGQSGLNQKVAASPSRQPSVGLDRVDDGAPATFQARASWSAPQLDAGALGSIAVLFGLVGVLGYGAWSVFQEVQRVQLGPVETAPVLVAQIDPLSSLSQPLSAKGGSVDPVTAGLNAPLLPDLPLLSRRDKPISTINPEEAGILAEAGTVSAVDAAIAEALEAEPTLAMQTTNEVAILAVRPAWVRVDAADGTVLFEKILNPGERYSVPPLDPVPTLRSGNSGSIYFVIAGQTYGPAGMGGSVVKNLSLSAIGLIETMAPADPAQDMDLALIAQAN